MTRLVSVILFIFVTLSFTNCFKTAQEVVAVLASDSTDWEQLSQPSSVIHGNPRIGYISLRSHCIELTCYEPACSTTKSVTLWVSHDCQSGSEKCAPMHSQHDVHTFVLHPNTMAELGGQDVTTAHVKLISCGQAEAPARTSTRALLQAANTTSSAVRTALDSMPMIMQLTPQPPASPPTEPATSSTALPDMEIDEEAMAVTELKWEVIDAQADPCLENESCLLGREGKRRVLRFDTKIWNRGEADVTIGSPPGCPTPDTTPEDQGDFTFDDCHWHWHYDGYAEYTLHKMKADGTVEKVTGRKTGFCLLDHRCPDGDELRKYTCGNQGITAGCYDLYGKDLNCQWIDVTDFYDDNSEFKLVVEVNVLRKIQETDYTNNAASVSFQFSQIPNSYVRGVYLPENQCPLPPQRGNPDFLDVFDIIELTKELESGFDADVGLVLDPLNALREELGQGRASGGQLTQHSSDTFAERLEEFPDLFNCPISPQTPWCTAKK